jgi:hypothetical protein
MSRKRENENKKYSSSLYAMIVGRYFVVAHHESCRCTGGWNQEGVRQWRRRCSPLMEQCAVRPPVTMAMELPKHAKLNHVEE